MLSVLHDLRYAARTLAKAPGFTLAVVLILALGIGANSAIVSVISGALLHVVPYPDAGRIVSVLESNPKAGLPYIQPSTANFFDWKDHNDSLDLISPWRFYYFNLSGAGDAERVQGFRVSANFFPLLGATTVLGRVFASDEEQPGRDRVVILTHGLWQRRFAAAPNIIGRRINIDGEAATVIGVLPAEFRMFRVLNREVELYMPLVVDPSRTSREDHALNVWARLKPGVPLERARAEMAAVGRRLALAYPKTNSDWGIAILTLPEGYVLRNQPAVAMLAVATGCVLLIVCVNVANLLLVRAGARRKEMAIRSALGASRSRIFRQLLTESLLLALAGAAAGLLVGMWAIRILNNSVTHLQVTRIAPFRMDGGVFALTLVIALGTGVLFGLAPGVEASRPDVADSLREGGRSGSAGRRSRLLADVLVVCEVALAVLLLAGAGAMLRASLNLVTMNRGLNPHNVLTMQVWLMKAKYASRPRVAGFFDEVLSRVQALPGVESAGAVNYPPAGILATTVRFAVEGRAPATRNERLTAHFWVISPDYFRTLGVPLTAGRAFGTEDADETRGSVIVSQSFAKRFWPGDQAIGKRIRTAFPPTEAFWLPYSVNLPLTVVGVAADIKEEGLDNAGLPQLYLPYRQNPSQIMHLLVRTAGPPLRWTGAVRSAVASVDRDQPVSEIKTMEDVAAEAFTRRSVVGYLLAFFAGCALVLAALGIYAVVAYSVGQRTKEFGIRMALGARRWKVIALVLGHAMRLVLLGLAIGLGGAFGLARTTSQFMFHTRMYDPATWTAVALLLIAVAALASYIPARRATRADPLDALRCE
ncbi:MAG TPA: ABC transporter permease [Bryobacteraceae bacterium]|nr:ABC transporter permease [Bryobacteraceae bacterium]